MALKHVWTTFKRPTLSSDYNLFATVIIGAIIVLSVIAYIIVYNSQDDKRDHDAQTQATLIESALIKTFDDNAHVAEFIGDKISSLGGNNLENISTLLSHDFALDVNLEPMDLFPWGVFSWVDANGRMLVSSYEGVLPEPRTIRMMPYLAQAKKEPMKLHLSSPVRDPQTDVAIILGAIGIRDRAGQYLGAITTSFEVDVITRNIQESLSEHGIRFMIMETDSHHVVMSTDYALSDKSSLMIANALQARNTILEKPMVFSDPIVINNTNYVFYKPIKKYPYSILVGYDRSFISQELSNQMFQYILLFTGMGLGFLVLLYVFKRVLIKPFVQLSSYADAIRRGENPPKAPRGNSYEVFNLSHQLIALRRKIHNEQKHKDKLDNAVKIARESELALEEFLRRANNELNAPLNAVISYTDILLKHYKGIVNLGITNDKLVDMLEGIYNAGLQLQTRVTNIVAAAEIDVADVITHCVKSMQLRSYIVKNITIDTDVSLNIPPFYTDEIRFKQVIVALICRAIEFNDKKGKILVTARAELNKERRTILVIQVKDKGLGLTEEDRKRIEQKHRGGVSRRSDGTDLELPAIEKLVTMLHGELAVQAVWREGTTVTLSLPYLTKEELETTPVDDDDLKAENEATPFDPTGKVVRFGDYNKD